MNIALAVLIVAIVGVILISPFFARMVEKDIQEEITAEQYERPSFENEKLKNRVTLEQLTICDGCPYEYLSIFLEDTDYRSASEIYKKYSVKCTHQRACLRAKYIGKHGMDRTEV